MILDLVEALTVHCSRAEPHAEPHLDSGCLLFMSGMWLVEVSCNLSDLRFFSALGWLASK
jgi:hypothetical protein